MLLRTSQTFLNEQGIQFPLAFFSPVPVVPALSFRQRGGQQEASTVIAVWEVAILCVCLRLESTQEAVRSYFPYKTMELQMCLRLLC